MKKRIIVATHASLSKGLVSSLKLIFDKGMEIETIEGFTVDKDPGSRFDEIMSTYDIDDVVVVLTDLSSGSVNKFIAERLKTKKFHLISGCNLMMLLEFACADVSSIDEKFIENVINGGRKDICYINELLMQNVAIEDDSFF